MKLKITQEEKKQVSINSISYREDEIPINNIFDKELKDFKTPLLYAFQYTAVNCHLWAFFLSLKNFQIMYLTYESISNVLKNKYDLTTRIGVLHLDNCRLLLMLLEDDLTLISDITVPM